MKKILCILLAVCLLIGIYPAAFAAENAYSDYPVIIVPGYGASSLFLENEDGTLGKQVWGWNIFSDMLLDQVKQEMEHPSDAAKAVRRCPRCGNVLKRRSGKFGEFWGCASYPDCKYTANI